MIKKAIKYLIDPDYRFMFNRAHGKYKEMPDEEYLKRLYHAETGRTLNLNEPKSFNEKLQWLKIHDRKDIYSTMADKYLVKEYVAQKIGAEHTIPLLGVWDTANEIDFDKLPEQFVLKCTHDSHGLVICKDKSKLDLSAAKDKLNKCLKRNYYYAFREWPYKNISPRVIAEKYMEDESGELKDYKVLCFDGVPRLIELHQGRFSGEHYQDFYDTQWEKTKIVQYGEQPHGSIAPKPEGLNEMLRLSGILSQNIPHVRVDWYIISGKPYFGEFTFYDASGMDLFLDERDDLMIGSWITVI